MNKPLENKLCQSIIFDKITYIIVDAITIQKLKLKLSVKDSSNNDKYIQELERQKKKFEDELSKFREHILKEYEGNQVLFHPQIERHIVIKNALLVIEESDTIIKSERALELWKFIYKNQNMLLSKPRF